MALWPDIATTHLAMRSSRTNPALSFSNMSLIAEDVHLPCSAPSNKRRSQKAEGKVPPRNLMPPIFNPGICLSRGFLQSFEKNSCTISYTVFCNWVSPYTVKSPTLQLILSKLLRSIILTRNTHCATLLEHVGPTAYCIQYTVCHQTLHPMTVMVWIKEMCCCTAKECI